MASESEETNTFLILLILYSNLLVLKFTKQTQPPLPRLLLLLQVYYEHLVYHCSLGNDLGSLPSYYILMFI